MIKILDSISLEELPKVAKLILEEIDKGNKWVAFYGEMGAGKTTLIKTICTLLGVTSSISSPTYGIVNEYETNEGEILYHFDFYRLKEETEAYDFGCEEYFYSGNVCLMEWPERIPNLLPENLLEVRIEETNGNRTFKISNV